MAEVVRYGVIGTGMMGCEHIRNISLIPDAEVVAVADSNDDSRHWGVEFAKGQATAYTDYRDVLANPTVDAVVVATPNFTHHAVLKDVFQSDKHVLIEKPLCTKVEQCHDILAWANAHPKMVWMGLQYRYMQAVRRLVEAVRTDAVGQLWMVAIREHRFPFLPKVDDWNRFTRNTGGTLVEKCCHFFDLMHLILAQRPVQVYASGAQNLNHLDERYNGETPDIMDNAFVIVDFDGGARGMLDLCMFAEGSRHEIEIAATGERGKVEAFEPDDTTIISPRYGEREEFSFDLPAELRMAGTHHGSTYYEHLDFLKAVRSGVLGNVTVEEGAIAVAMGAAAEMSIRAGRPVTLKEIGF